MKKKKLLLAAASLALIGSSAFLSTSTPLRISAEGEEPTTSEQATFELPQEVKEEISYWKKLYYDYIVPLLGGVSVASIVAAAVNIAISILKRKRDKTFIEKVDARIGRLEVLLKGALSLMDTATKLIDSFDNNTGNITQTVSLFIEKADAFLVSVSDLCGEVEALQPIRGQLALLTEVQGKIASHTQELVSSGVAEEIKGLLAEIKEVEANGTQG